VARPWLAARRGRRLRCPGGGHDPCRALRPAPRLDRHRNPGDKDTMKILFCGDVMGSVGRRVVLDNLPRLKRDLDLDFVIVNGENAAHGFGITEEICDQLFAAGTDCITTGNHVWDRRDIIPHFQRETRLLRPYNFPKGTPGRGARVFDARGGRKVFVLHLMARLYMDPLDDPFAAAEEELEAHKLGQTVDAVVIDFHGEATSEKTAMGHYADGRASLVV